MDSFPVEIHASLSKHLAEGADEAVFGRYRFSRAAGDGARGDIVLSFTSTYWHPEGGGSHPEEEAMTSNIDERELSPIIVRVARKQINCCPFYDEPTRLAGSCGESDRSRATPSPSREPTALVT